MIDINSITRFSDLFKEKVKCKEFYLKGIPTKLIIGHLSLINAKLYLSRSNKNIQCEILKEVLSWSDSTTSQIFQNFKSSSRQGLFDIQTSLEMMKYAISKDNNLTYDYKKSKKLDILNFLRAYLLFLQSKNDRSRKDILRETNIDKFYFERIAWPSIVLGLHLNWEEDPFEQLFKGYFFLKFFETFESGIFLQNFLKNTGFKSAKDFIKIHFIILGKVFGGKNHLLSTDSEFINKIFGEYCINKEILISHSKPYDFIPFKEMPLYEVDSYSYFVLNINFLTVKLYNDLVFKFKKDSSIEEKYTNYLSLIGTEFAEKFLFRKIIKYCFHNISYQFGNDQKGELDCVIVDQDNIFLIEFKNVLFPGEVKESRVFDIIKEHIDKKLIEKKGVKQIINNLTINKSSLIEKNIQNKNSAVIYPIIIYTDRTWGMPGINDYVNYCFKEEFEKINTSYKVVKDLVMINLRIFIKCIYQFNKGEIILSALIDNYFVHKDQLDPGRKKYGIESLPELLPEIPASLPDLDQLDKIIAFTD